MIAWVSIVAFSSILVYLVLEKLQIREYHRNIPIRIGVTGTRGKSSIVRLITFLLQKEGVRCMGKVTGTNARLILPDSSEIPVPRKAPASISEQKKVLLKRAYRAHVQAIVSEVMSITPEYQFTETKKYLDPNYLVISNVREDHLGVTGSSIEEIASVFYYSANPRTKLIAENTFFDIIPAHKKKSLDTLSVFPDQTEFDPNDFCYPEFRSNYALALSCVKEVLGRNPDSIQLLKQLKPDKGVVKNWQWLDIRFISAFAANDPESTFQLLEKCETLFGFDRKEVSGLCNLRIDKGERTLQWLEYMKKHGIPFKKLYLVGGHSLALAMRMKSSKIELLQNKTMKSFLETARKNADRYIFGFGNVKGFGEKFIRHFEAVEFTK